MVALPVAMRPKEDVKVQPVKVAAAPCTALTASVHVNRHLRSVADNRVPQQTRAPPASQRGAFCWS